MKASSPKGPGVKPHLTTTPDGIQKHFYRRRCNYTLAVVVVQEALAVTPPHSHPPHARPPPQVAPWRPTPPPHAVFAFAFLEVCLSAGGRCGVRGQRFDLFKRLEVRKLDQLDGA